MELTIASEPTEDCDYWHKSDDSQWLASITSNVVLAAAFSVSYYVQEPWIWIRLLLVAAHGVTAHLAVNRCQVKAFVWAVLLISINVYRLLKTAYNHRPNRIPSYLQDIYTTVFKIYNVTRPDFAAIIGNGRLQGIGPEEPFQIEGHLRYDHADLCLLISGRLTAWCDGLPVHSIMPGQFINSVEWSSFRKDFGSNDFGWEQQVTVQAEEDSLYLRISGDHLECLQSHNDNLWMILESIVSRDVAKKLYEINDRFERVSRERAEERRKALAKHVVRSVSLEALHISSKGWVVTDNWLKADTRASILACPHASDGMPIDDSFPRKRRHSYANLAQVCHIESSCVAYLMRNSHVELIKEAREFGTVVPSLRMQALMIDRDSCRFRDETIIRDYEWDQSWNHCGNCQTCKPLSEGEPAVQQPASAKH